MIKKGRVADYKEYTEWLRLFQPNDMPTKEEYDKYSVGEKKAIADIIDYGNTNWDS